MLKIISHQGFAILGLSQLVGISEHLLLAGMDVPGRLQTERDFFEVGMISIGTDIDSTGV